MGFFVSLIGLLMGLFTFIIYPLGILMSFGLGVFFYPIYWFFNALFIVVFGPRKWWYFIPIIMETMMVFNGLTVEWGG